ncbi:hypothetical protein THF1C08_30365 [Vibrio jasicida]|uniref:Uncharacterized protein n=1 Tax=Vibrio jasicida TaxID=766224 RepID=A0AAU9QRL8_9VIBR|nr:hypothetical protein THF1C08_30365 [Vibrio jasicida]CAH1599244.1 hypothetical protein THF1A12_40069 [Vibrio jasicida]
MMHFNGAVRPERNIAVFALMAKSECCISLQAGSGDLGAVLGILLS